MMITYNNSNFNTVLMFLLSPFVHVCVMVFVLVMIAYRITETIIQYFLGN